MKRRGIMGGTFNPVHFGHLVAAESVREQLKLDEILFIPTGNPPHKSAQLVLDSTDRLEMLRLAIDGNTNFTLNDMEIKREGKTYTYDTLVELQQLFPGDQFYFIIGFDTLMEIGTWRNIDEVAKLCSFAVVDRCSTPEEVQLQRNRTIDRYGLKVAYVDMPNIGLSSTDIRGRMKEQRSIRYMVPDAVFEYIEKKSLYR